MRNIIVTMVPLGGGLRREGTNLRLILPSCFFLFSSSTLSMASCSFFFSLPFHPFRGVPFSSLCFFFCSWLISSDRSFVWERGCSGSDRVRR